MKLIKIITKYGEFYYGKDKIELKNKINSKKDLLLINDLYTVISSDKIVFECECGNIVTSNYSNFKNRKHSLCVSCIRKITIKIMYSSLSNKDKIKRNNNISEKTKQAMQLISPEKRQEMTQKMLKSMDWDKRNKRWKETMSSKTDDEKQIIYKKVSKTLKAKTTQEKYIIKNKIETTCLKRYGVRSVSQNPQILKKQIENRNDAWKLKIYKSIFGDIAYQTKAELIFIKYCESNNLVVFNGPAIDYYLNNNLNKYTIDFEMDNYLIEIKQSHIWYINDIISGKIDAKNKAAQEYAALNNKQFIFLLDIKDYSQFIQKQ